MLQVDFGDVKEVVDIVQHSLTPHAATVRTYEGYNMPIINLESQYGQGIDTIITILFRTNYHTIFRRPILWKSNVTVPPLGYGTYKIHSPWVK